ncbi:DUF47 domain-containing protein, partial [Candidatus Riflebacteria bacterium]
IQKHCDIVGECLKEFEKFVKDYLSLEKELKEKVLTVRGKYKDGSFRVHELESEADDLRSQIFNLLNEGAFLPNVREDYAKIVKIVDKIANKAEGASDFIMLEAPYLPAKYHEPFLNILEHVTNGFSHIDNIVDLFYTDQDKIEEENLKVADLESESDRLEWDILKKVFMDKELDLAHKMHIRDLVQHVGAISNLIEDAADFIRIIVIRRKL